MSRLNSYFSQSIYETDIDAYSQMVELYSYSRVVRGQVKRGLRRQLINLLSLYMKMGYSRDTKNYAAEFLNIDPKTINCMNKELTDMGYLVKESENFVVHDKTMNQELIALKNYCDGQFMGEKPSMFFTFKLDAPR